MREKKGKIFQVYKVDFRNKRDEREKREIFSNKKYQTLKNRVFNPQYLKNKKASLFSLFSLICERWFRGKKFL